MEPTRIQINISQIAVEEYCLSFYKLGKEDLDCIRDDIYDMIELVEEDPELVNEEGIMADITEAMTMRQALIQLNKLHDC